MKPAKIAIVGATGLVGREFLEIFSRNSDNSDQLDPVLLASARSDGTIIRVGNRPLTVRSVDEALSEGSTLLDNVRFAFFSAGSEASRRYAPEFVQRKITIIDNSSAFRLDRDVPLIVPEVNGDELNTPENAAEVAKAFSPQIIANPNCSTIQMIHFLEPLQRLFGLLSVQVATYQSVSGAGQAACQQLKQESAKILRQRCNAAESTESTETVFSRPIGFNLIPQIGDFDLSSGGYTTEELKMIYETRKILKLPELAISATCVRVPVFRGHFEVISCDLKRPADIEKLTAELNQPRYQSYLKLVEADSNEITPLFCERSFHTLISRLRVDPQIPTRLNAVCLADNLWTGAALNGYRIFQQLRK